jgi:hypothetical protein
MISYYAGKFNILIPKRGSDRGMKKEISPHFKVDDISIYVNKKGLF